MAAWLLEFAVYSACIIRLSDLIIQGIQEQGDTSMALFAVRILLTESMVFLYPLWRLLRLEQEHDCGVVVKRDGMFFLTMCLLLTVVLQGWQDTELIRAFVREAGYLLLFLGFVYIEERHKMQKYRNTPGSSEDGPFFVSREESDSEGLQRRRQAEYLKNVEQQYQRTRELWHDLKNHIKILEILAEEERFGELSDYLDSFRRDVELRMIPTKTGCAAVDALLGDKLYLAGKQGTEMILELCDLSEIRIQSVDLCVILGNLLDNALEACAMLSEGGRIRLRLKQEEGFYYLKIVNTAHEPVKENGKYLSGKKGWDNKVGHGLGLRSTERIAHQYGGMLVTDYQDGEFTAIVRLEAAAPNG